MFPQGERLTMICASLVLLQIMFAVHRFAQGAGIRVLKMDRPDGRRVLKFDGPLGRGLRIALTGNAYKVSVTDLPFCVIRYDRHSADWLGGRAAPVTASPLDTPSV